MEASKTQFACANPEKSEKTKQIIQAIVEDENSKVDVNKVKARNVPDFKKDAVPVKMTAAAIMREGLLYQKQENEVMHKLRQLEAGAYDASEFNKWQNEQRQQDLEAEIAAIEERRLLGKLSHEEAILARTNVMAKNQERVRGIKEETAVMMREFLDKKFQEEKEMKMLVENTMAGHRNAKDAKKRLTEYKQKIDMRCKMELIQQIRAMESTPVSRFKVVDLTSTSGAGLLGEMSIVELRERLALLKEKQLEEEEEKRDIILNAKQAKADYLSETLDRISKHRAEQTRSAAVKLEERKKNQSAPTPFRNEALSELERKLQEKRAERIREQQKSQVLPSRASANRTKSLISQKKNLEASRWQELEQAQERSAKFLAQIRLVVAAAAAAAAVAVVVVVVVVVVGMVVLFVLE
ncbi:cilia- and flagella-associated protein 99-like [Elysia marginata]|uniref:Cilia- and flagella-associated protein 99-like n=1 Tax=Elysia marginata TaxID=1093978 RepID=A0AAV4JCL3_9GAST|nr:cilia- and flagella-associated protein 99-like [Elysia marginata]